MISTNIILFSEKPLETNIQVYSYEVSKECSYYDIGDIILETRPFHKNVIIFQYGLLILSSKSLKFPRKHQKDIITEKIITLSLNVPEDLEKLQYLLGEAIASFLRIQDNDKWRANRGKGLVYYAQKLLGSQEFQPLSVWEGFKYTPIVFKDGRAGIIIDPRFKIYHRKNLRDLSPKERKLLVNQTVIDTCPNDDCTLKKDPFSTCKLSGDGKPVKLKRFNYKLNAQKAQVPFNDKMVNLIEYSDNPKTCPLHILSDFIDEFEPPVAIVKINEEGKNYTYPIERLRKFAVFSDVINQKARRQLMQLVQPRPNKRYNMTKIFTEDVLSSINFDPISLNVDEFVSSNNKEFKFGTSEPVELLLYNDKMFQNPAIEIESEKPYDYNIRKFSNINVVFIKYGTFQDELQLISSFIDIILNGYDEDISIPSLKSYVSLSSVEIVGNVYIFSDYKDKEEDFFKKITDIIKKTASEDDRTIVLNIYGEPEDSFNEDSIKSAFIINDIPNQGMSLAKLQEVMEDGGKFKGYIKNIYLGIYAKIGGVIWALPKDLMISALIKEKPEDYIILGYSSIIKESSLIFSITKYDYQGIWKKGVISSITKELKVSNKNNENKNINNSSNNLEIKLYEIFKNNLFINNKSTVIIHVKGQLKPFIELEPIKNVLNKIGCKYSLIEFMESPLRLYDLSKSDAESVIGGTWVKIKEDLISILTYYFKSSSKTPDPIICKKILGNFTLFESEIKYSFYLTQCYTGYLNQRIKYPITAYTASKILSKNPFDEEVFLHEFYTQWFI